jgi:hypothetical protein
MAYSCVRVFEFSFSLEATWHDTDFDNFQTEANLLTRIFYFLSFTDLEYSSLSH